MMEYEEICRYSGVGTPIYLYGPWDLERFRFLPPLYGPWDLKKFHARASFRALGLKKFQALPLYRLI